MVGRGAYCEVLTKNGRAIVGGQMPAAKWPYKGLPEEMKKLPAGGGMLEGIIYTIVLALIGIYVLKPILLSLKDMFI